MGQRFGSVLLPILAETSASLSEEVVTQRNEAEKPLGERPGNGGDGEVIEWISTERLLVEGKRFPKRALYLFLGAFVQSTAGLAEADGQIDMADALRMDVVGPDLEGERTRRDLEGAPFPASTSETDNTEISQSTGDIPTRTRSV